MCVTFVLPRFTSAPNKQTTHNNCALAVPPISMTKRRQIHTSLLLSSSFAERSRSIAFFIISFTCCHVPFGCRREKYYGGGSVSKERVEGHAGDHSLFLFFLGCFLLYSSFHALFSFLALTLFFTLLYSTYILIRAAGRVVNCRLQSCIDMTMSRKNTCL